MPVEIEIKLKVDHLAPVRDRLREIGAKHVGEVMETNIFFDTPDRGLLSQDCGMRLRRARDHATHKETLIVTWKGPRAEGEVKQREEIEVVVDQIDSTVKLLAQLGYDEMLRFEKRRESWRIGHCKVELDTLPQLGSFVEIECNSQHEVQDIRKKLGLANVAPVMPTYADLVSHVLSDRGHGENALTFQ